MKMLDNTDEYQDLKIAFEITLSMVMVHDYTSSGADGSRILWRGGGAFWNLDPNGSIPKPLADVYISRRIFYSHFACFF